MAIQLLYNHFDRTNFNNHSDYRKHIAAHLKAVLLTRSVLNIETQLTIRFNKVGIEKMVSKIGDVKAFALCNLQPILRNSTLAETQQDKRGRPDIICVRIFKIAADIEGSVYEVWTYVKETNSGNYLYSLHVDVKKTL